MKISAGNEQEKLNRILARIHEGYYSTQGVIDLIVEKVINEITVKNKPHPKINP